MLGVPEGVQVYDERRSLFIAKGKAVGLLRSGLFSHLLIFFL